MNQNVVEIGVRNASNILLCSCFKKCVYLQTFEAALFLEEEEEDQTKNYNVLTLDYSDISRVLKTSSLLSKNYPIACTI